MIACVKTTNNEAVAAATSVAPQRWPRLLNELTDTVIDPHLARPETRATTREVIGSLLAPLTTKNCWSLAQQALPDPAPADPGQHGRGAPGRRPARLPHRPPRHSGRGFGRG